MTSFEKYSLGIAAIAVIVSAIAMFVSVWSAKTANRAGKTAEEAAKKANLISEGTIELYLNEIMSNSRARQSQIILATLPELSGSEKANRILGLLDEAREDYLNAIEEACSKYLDSKIDQDRFKASYQYQIKNVMDDPQSKRIIQLRVNRFTSIETVYSKWFPSQR